VSSEKVTSGGTSVAVKAQPMSDMMALSAIELLSEYLPQAWANPNQIEARARTLMGAMQAGIAFSNTPAALVHGAAPEEIVSLHCAAL
jgi:alcohol dehydrogenase